MNLIHVLGGFITAAIVLAISSWFNRHDVRRSIRKRRLIKHPDITIEWSGYSIAVRGYPAKQTLRLGQYMINLHHPEPIKFVSIFS